MNPSDPIAAGQENPRCTTCDRMLPEWSKDEPCHCKAGEGCTIPEDSE